MYANNAALLAHRLGDGNVFTVDIDPQLVSSARHRLAELGYRPALAAADGADGLVLVDVKVSAVVGNLVLLRRDGDRIEGRCEVATGDDGDRRVTEGGPRPLWQTLEDLHDLWTRAGQPGWDRFGLTVGRRAQTVWLDDPDGEFRWEL